MSSELVFLLVFFLWMIALVCLSGAVVWALGKLGIDVLKWF